MKKNGAQIVLEVLKENNIDTIFGYPGGAVIPFYHELAAQYDHFNHIRTAHEQGAVHAADGYSRSTGGLGVCVVTSGPGVTNTITGIATAYMDSAPLLVISGQVPSVLLGKDSFQEVDITGIAMPITKYTFLVRELDELEGVIRKAIKVATSGRPGPVLIDIPKDLFTKETAYPSAKALNYNISLPEVDKAAVLKACEMINAAKKPMVYAGGGVRIADASEGLRKLCLEKEIPIVNTLMSLGTFPRTHKLSLGMVGMHGYPEANMAITHSDLIIAIGARFSDRVIGNPKDFAPGAKVIHIDYDFTEFSKNIDSDIDICGDLNEILDIMNANTTAQDLSKWHEEIASFEDPGAPKPKDILNAKCIIEKVAEVVGENSVVATDVGQHQMWTAQFYPFTSPKQFITSGGLGTMGFGLGAAIGTTLGNPDKRIVLFTGDGSFRMNCHELVTVSGYKLPILIVLLNNQALGMVRQWQKLFQGERYAETTISQNVDYVKLNEAYGIKGVQCNDIEALEAAVKTFVESGESLFVECHIDQNEDVYPIVPPGESIAKYINR